MNRLNFHVRNIYIVWCARGCVWVCSANIEPSENVFWIDKWIISFCFYFFRFSAADDDSDTHDFDGAGSDVEYGGADHRHIGQHSFSQMQVCVIALRVLNSVASGAAVDGRYLFFFRTGWLGSSTFAWQSTTHCIVRGGCDWWQQWRSRTSRTVRNCGIYFVLFLQTPVRHWNFVLRTFSYSCENCLHFSMRDIPIQWENTFW